MYLQHHYRARHRPKTLAWHQTALGQFQRYLLVERRVLWVSQLSETDVRGWFAFLQEMPTASGKQRSAHTIATYARSVRAFCDWLVCRGDLARSPCEEVAFPEAGPSLPRVLTAEYFEQLLLTCHPPGESGPLAERAAARNRAILWMLFDTGISLSELCALRLGDVDCTRGIVTIGGQGTRARCLALGPQSFRQLLSYLEQHRPKQEELVTVRSRPGRSRRLASNGKVVLARRLFADPNHSIPEICSTLEISRSTWYRYGRKTQEETCIPAEREISRFIFTP